VFADSPVLVNVVLEKSFIPIGFDDNDKVQVVVTGTFSNACYRVGPYQVQTDRENRKVHIRQSAYLYPGWCLQIMIPFTQVIDIGLLPSGEYTVGDATNGNVLGKLPVTVAKSQGADDFLYAPVTDAFIQITSDKPILTLKGNFTDRCMQLKKTVVHYYPDIIVVQPIVEMSEDTSLCGHDLIRFQRETVLSTALKGNYLLHVRSVDGQAINKIVEFP